MRAISSSLRLTLIHRTRLPKVSTRESIVAVGESVLTRAYTSFPVSSLRIRESSKSRGSSDLFRLFKNSLHPSGPFAFI